MNPKLKHLMKELGEAINDSLSESEEIAEVISKIKAAVMTFSWCWKPRSALTSKNRKRMRRRAQDAIRAMLISKSPVKT